MSPASLPLWLMTAGGGPARLRRSATHIEALGLVAHPGWTFLSAATTQPNGSTRKVIGAAVPGSCHVSRAKLVEDWPDDPLVSTNTWPPSPSRPFKAIEEVTKPGLDPTPGGRVRGRTIWPTARLHWMLGHVAWTQHKPASTDLALRISANQAN